MSEATLTRIAAACFLLGLGLVFLVDLGIARIIGIPLMFTGIFLGVRAIASPEFLAADEENAEEQ